MLILTRQVDQQIDIGSDIKLTVLGVAEGRVKIGIEAPLDVVINRTEAKNKRNARTVKEPNDL